MPFRCATHTSKKTLTKSESVVNEDKKPVEVIKQPEKSTDKEVEVFESSKEITFLTESSNNNEEKKDNNPPTKIKSVRNQHVMISYNSESRNMCLKIKEQLEKLKFKVWIDVGSMHGSSLDSMAKAVENSFCVLICMSENYKMSNNCRTEAEYTFQLGKPFIPIKVNS